MTDTALPGPIDFVLLEFPDQEPSGVAAAALVELIDAGIVRLYDLAAIRKAADGSVGAIELSALPGDGGFAGLSGAQSGLLSDEDVTEAAAAMKPGTIAVLLIFENAWASRFVTAVDSIGGEMIASSRIPAQDIVDALDALEASG